MPVITLLSDFGTRDYFVGAVKGIMLGLNPDATMVDISHEIPPQDVFTGAFTLNQVYSCFPQGTVHFAVVDPGVGTGRKALAASAAGHYFVAPDNGILTYIMEANEDFIAYEITADHYFRKPVSATFHGRDVFAPIAAWLSRRIELHKLGPVLKSPMRLQIPALKKVGDTMIQGTVLAVDRFGNLITNLKPEDISMPFKILAGQREITALRKTYGEGMPGELIVVPGSAGYLEIAMKGGSASAALSMKAGAPIGVILQ